MKIPPDASNVYTFSDKRITDSVDNISDPQTIQQIPRIETKIRVFVSLKHPRRVIRLLSRVVLPIQHHGTDSSFGS